ncbi:hypothetical protein MTO96_038809 [Rhipicephalus appendiculatus]
MDQSAAKGSEPSREAKKSSPFQSGSSSDRGRDTSSYSSDNLSSTDTSPTRSDGNLQGGRGREAPAAHAEGSPRRSLMVTARAVHRSPSSGSRVAFQAPGPEDLVAASRECLEGVLDELNIAIMASTGRGSPDSETGGLKPSPSKTSLDHRVSFGVTSVSEEKLPTSRETSPVAGAAGAKYSGVRTPPTNRPMTDEFDISLTEEVDVLLDDDDDMLDPEERARRRRSSAASASGTSAISDELDAPIFSGRVRPPLGLLSATPSLPAEDQLTAAASQKVAEMNLDAAGARCNTGGSSVDEGKGSILASPKRASAEQLHGQGQGVRGSENVLQDERADKTVRCIPEVQPELATPAEQVDSAYDWFSSPAIGSISTEEGGATRGVRSIGSEEPGREMFSSRFTQSLSAVLRSAIVIATSRRFYMLAIYCATSLVNGFQWIEYAIIASVVQEYYGVSEVAVAWTSLVYHIGCVTLALPSSWILENMGLRVSVILGALGTSIGSCVKIFSVQPDRFGYVLVGQTFPAFSLAFLVGVPSRLASAWFKYEEVSTACSIGVLGSQVGIALGFFVPPYIVDPMNVQATLTTLCVIVAVASVVCLLVTILAFEDKPENPPSFSEMLNRYAEKKPTFAQALYRLMRDRDFCLLLLSYGLNTGAFYSISTLLNPVVIRYFPGEENFAGLLGVIIVVSGLLGSWAAGWVLDKTGKYKEVSVVTYAFSTLGLFLYTFVLSLRSRWLIGTACSFLGLFLAGYIPVGLQLGAEITYPLPEGTSACVLNMASESCGFVLILSSTNVLRTYGDRVSNLALSGMLLVGCICIVNLRATLKRQLATLRVQRKRSAATCGGLRASLRSPAPAAPT